MLYYNKIFFIIAICLGSVFLNPTYSQTTIMYSFHLYSDKGNPIDLKNTDSYEVSLFYNLGESFDFSHDKDLTAKKPAVVQNKSTIYGCDLSAIEGNEIQIKFFGDDAEFTDFFMVIRNKKRNNQMRVLFPLCPFSFSSPDTIFYKEGFYYKLPYGFFNNPKDRLVREIPFPPRSNIKVRRTPSNPKRLLFNWESIFNINQNKYARARIPHYCSMDQRDSSFNSRVFGHVTPPFPSDTNWFSTDSSGQLHYPHYSPYDVFFSFYGKDGKDSTCSNCSISVFYSNQSEDSSFAIKDCEGLKYGNASPPWYVFNPRQRAEIRFTCDGKKMIIDFNSDVTKHLRIDSIPFIPGKWKVHADRLLKEKYGDEKDDVYNITPSHWENSEGVQRVD